MANLFRETANRAKANPHGETPVASPAPVPEAQPKQHNPLASMKLEKPMGKSYAVYLDVELVEKIDRLAEMNKTNRSKIINTLLNDIIDKL